MGVYSTMDITREDAVNLLREKLDSSDEITDDELSEMMFGLFSERTLNNFSIVPKYDESRDGANYTEGCLDGRV